MVFRLADRPLSPLGRVRLYVCGITPYDTTHLGHAFVFTWVDTLARVLEHVGVEVQVCRNITDVDDALLNEARRLGERWQMLASRQTFQFEDDMRHLRVRRPAFEPMSHEYIDAVIFLALALIEGGVAYERDGAVYFRGGDLPDRAGIGREEGLALHREGHGHPDDPAKDDPFDAAVWQPSRADEPAWPSPWGSGRPGWHAECAAMATSVLGLSVDVHAGGKDLAFPHHTYEAAMVEAATGVVPFARSWMHVGTVHVNGAKMAKSTGNLVFVNDLLQEYDAAVIRCLLLDRPWFDDWGLDDAELGRAGERLEALWSAAGRSASSTSDEVAEAEAVRLLVEGQQTGAALDVAIAEGGATARMVGRLLALT